MTPNAIIIGIGNDFRRDDGVGLAVAQRIAERNLPGVRVLSGISESTAMLDAWSGASRAVVVDAVTGANSDPGRIRRWTGPDLETSAVVSSHALGLAQTCALGQALARMPNELVVFTVDVVDTNHGIGLTPAVAAAVPNLVDVIVAELSR
ncbi:MAG TPA: hydrogenase maturation protease [Mycobacterium sp.]|uniref:hydrogenase maturation protease n=1 Tax=Mycobacterium sp. TaxID=1785 RepID=UPI002BE51B15|nr:hydrogenase maturation protease [Mycobacterium sp.]HME80409.1 hydrogenase maturation protease [Mycobacterium sp.]